MQGRKADANTGPPGIGAGDDANDRTMRLPHPGIKFCKMLKLTRYVA